MVRVKRNRNQKKPLQTKALKEVENHRGPRRANGKTRPWRPMKAILREILTEELPSGATRGDFVVSKLVELARSGDLRAIDMVLDRVDGKPGSDLSGNETSEEKARALLRDLQMMDATSSGEFSEENGHAS